MDGWMDAMNIVEDTHNGELCLPTSLGDKSACLAIVGSRIGLKVVAFLSKF